MSPQPRGRWGGGRAVAGILAAVVLAGCAGQSAGSVPTGGGGSSTAAPAGGTVTLYTCASENVEQAVIKAFEKIHPTVQVVPFRAATGPLNAKIAADLRSGGIQADVIWACDPLTMHGYDQQGLLAAWSPANAAKIPAAFRTADFTGIAVLYMVLAVHKGVPAPAQWSDLTSAAYRDAVALPSPSFAASALGMLGYFSAASGYGLAYYRQLKANGAVQVDSPTDTLTGVEQGRYKAGFTLANTAYADQQKGSPVDVVWPRPGAIAIYGPIGLTTKANRSPLAGMFADFAASEPGQQAIAAQGSYVTLPSVTGPLIPDGSPVVSPDWPALFTSAAAVTESYSTIFGG